MPRFSQDQLHDGNPTAAEIFRVFRNTTMASISGLRLLLEECADLRAELVTVHRLHNDGDGNGAFSGRQANRILELQGAQQEMEALLVSLSAEAGDGPTDASHED